MVRKKTQIELHSPSDALRSSAHGPYSIVDLSDERQIAHVFFEKKARNEWKRRSLFIAG